MFRLSAFSAKAYMLTGKQFDNYLCIDDLGILYRQLDGLAKHQQVYVFVHVILHSGL